MTELELTPAGKIRRTKENVLIALDNAKDMLALTKDFDNAAIVRDMWRKIKDEERDIYGDKKSPNRKS